jgi:hypothetical protein
MSDVGEWGEHLWNKNLYNKANGGPCEKPEDFFTNEEAKKHYKNRLRYVISRWGYSPHIAAFELWNEMDAPPEWTKEMLTYIRGVNPHGQLLTTSLGYPWGNNFDESVIWSQYDIDIVQWHTYGERIRDVLGNLISVNTELTKHYDDKPLLVGEFSMDSSVNDKNYDITGEGVALHNSIWASMLTRSFSGAMNWWWAGYVRGKNLYYHYKALRNFVKDVKWDSRGIFFLETTPVAYDNPPTKKTSYSNAMITTYKKWGEMHYREFYIKNNGDVVGGPINGYLHGSLKPKFRIMPVFHVNFPTAGKFIIRIDIVSQGGRFFAYLDGKEVVNRDFPVGTGKGPWQRSLFRKDKKIYQCAYNCDVEIDVPKGEHTIRLKNVGKDWMGIKKITLTKYKSSNFADARVLGLAVGDEMLFWVQNKDYNWRNLYKGIKPSKIIDTSFTVKNVENAMYDIEWWDTFRGEIISREEAKAKRAVLHVKVPEFSKDIACKIRKR